MRCSVLREMRVCQWLWERGARNVPWSDVIERRDQLDENQPSMIVWGQWTHPHKTTPGIEDPHRHERDEVGQHGWRSGVHARTGVFMWTLRPSNIQLSQDRFTKNSKDRYRARRVVCRLLLTKPKRVYRMTLTQTDLSLLRARIAEFTDTCLADTLAIKTAQAADADPLSAAHDQALLVANACRDEQQRRLTGGSIEDMPELRL